MFIFFLLFEWIKTDLHICNLWTGQFVCYKSAVYNFDIRHQLEHFDYEMNQKLLLDCCNVGFLRQSFVL